MSWTIGAIGKPAAVKAALKKQFESARQGTANVPHEQASVDSIEQIVNGQLDYLVDVPGTAVKVAANGSAYKSMHGDAALSGHSSVTLTVEPVYGYVE